MNKFHAGRLKNTKGTPAIPETAGLRYIIQIGDGSEKYSDNHSSASIKNRWTAVETEYRKWYFSRHGKLNPGDIHTIYVQSDTVIVFMVAEKKGKIDKDAFKLCCNALYKHVQYEKNMNFHFGRKELGSKTKYKEIEQIINDELVNKGLNVFIYE